MSGYFKTSDPLFLAIDHQCMYISLPKESLGLLFHFIFQDVQSLKAEIKLVNNINA